MKYLIYDADCGICTKLAEFYAKQVRNVVILPSYEAIEQNLTDIDTIQKTVVYIENRNQSHKSEAVFKAMKQMNLIFKIPAYLCDNKLFILIFNPIYDIVARNRAKISQFFGLNSCTIKYDD